MTFYPLRGLKKVGLLFQHPEKACLFSGLLDHLVGCLDFLGGFGSQL
jgi:hypothetical protein